jgi:hypothetical protein
MAEQNSTTAKSMAITYPIIETQMRLIRALQKGYVEALEAGDWQAANYRCIHLHKLCEGLRYLSEILDREGKIPDTLTPRSNNSWVSSIHTTNSIHSLTSAPEAVDKPVVTSPSSPEPMHYEWGMGLQAVEPPPIDEVW